LLNSNTRIAQIVPLTEKTSVMYTGEDLDWKTTDTVPKFQCNPKLTSSQKEKLGDLLNSHKIAFMEKSEKVPTTTKVMHRIDTGNAVPIAQPPYRKSVKEQERIDILIDDMLQQGIVSPSNSPWCSPIVLVPKPNGKWRFCVDFRKVNAITKKDVYPLPRIDTILDSLQGAKYFSTLDLHAGYHQVPMHPDDKEKTAFISQSGLYEFNKMAFGLCNAPATFQRMMDSTLAGLKWNICLVYLDDIIVYSTNFDEHLSRLDKVIKAVKLAGLKFNPDKCKFAFT